jgi:uncharacterized protein YbcI
MPSTQGETGRIALAASNAITRLHREHHGRGATSTRTIVQRNYVIVFLEDIYTPLERTLIDAGNEETVKETRQVFQLTMRERFTAAIEEITGRKVIAFMSQVHFDPDMAAEIFVLEPTSQERATAESDGTGE